MTIYGPACTCPPTSKKIPHRDGCPRGQYARRAWSIKDRAECQQQREVAK